MTNTKPLIFTNDDANSDGESLTMDVLLNYAKIGMAEAEAMIKNDPGMFSPDELAAFKENKSTMVAAPVILNDYKQKLSEYNNLQSKVQGVLSKCETIYTDYETKLKNAEGVKNIEERPGPKTIRYSKDGTMSINTDEK